MTRLDINVNDEVAATLRVLAYDLDVSVTEVVRRAVSTHYFFRQQVREGKRVRVVGGGESVTVQIP